MKTKAQRDLERAHQATRDAKNLRQRDLESQAAQLAQKDNEIRNLQRALDDERKKRSGPTLTTGEVAEVLKASSFLITLAHRAIGNGHG